MLSSTAHSLLYWHFFKWQIPMGYLPIGKVANWYEGIKSPPLSAIRNNQGGWLAWFLCNLGFCSSPEAELWGAVEALKLAWKMGLKKIVLNCWWIHCKLIRKCNSRTKSCWYSAGNCCRLSGKFLYARGKSMWGLDSKLQSQTWAGIKVLQSPYK